MKGVSVTLSAILPLLFVGYAKGASPVGYWKTIDDETGKPRSIVYIWSEGQTLSGKIVQLFRQPEEEADPFCIECKGPLKREKIVGLKILSGLEQDGDEWGDGEILDPKNGKTYSCYVEVQDHGKKLKVRGYLGISLLGRTQYWHRAPKPNPNIRSFRLETDGRVVPIAWEKKPGAPEPPAEGTEQPPVGD